MNGESNNFDYNVFVNCPFDDDYISMLRPLLFAIIYLGYNPRIASERSDAGELRMLKIRELIEDSKISIHDLCRSSSEEKGDYYRMNMPFELGIDIGCRVYKTGLSEGKKCLILEKEKFSYLKAISDMSGSDIKCHKGEPIEIVYQVRNWFVENELDKIDSAAKIWSRFNEFMADLGIKLKDNGYKKKDIDCMPIREYIGFIKEWLSEKCEPPFDI